MLAGRLLVARSAQASASGALASSRGMRDGLTLKRVPADSGCKLRDGDAAVSGDQDVHGGRFVEACRTAP